MTTIKEVAQRAGVSTATVSRALTGSSQVNPELRERIAAAVVELGYRPNRLASNMRRQSTETVGIVVSDIENPHFTQVVRAVEDNAYRRGYRMLLCNTDETPEKQRSYLEVLAAERVLGVILAPSNPQGPEIAALIDQGIPVVAFDRMVSDPRADSVVVDNIEGARRATNHLLNLGHRRIGFVAGLPHIQTAHDRLLGYEEAMLARGCTPVHANGAFRIDQAYKATEQLLDDGDLTGMVISNNLMSIGALKALRNRGLRVPDAVAIVAIDDPPWAELVEPAMTTLAQPIRRMAEVAVTLLFERIKGSRTTPKTVIFDLELRVRQSCGAGLVRGDSGGGNYNKIQPG